MATVDIIIPYFQRTPEPLQRAITSIASQTAGDVRILVVDDASPLPAEAAVSGLTRDVREKLEILHRPNGGPGPARNTGLDAVGADTRFVAFLDSDDTWAPGHLENAVRALEASDAKIYGDRIMDADATFAEGYRAPSAVVRPELRAPLDDAETFLVPNLAKALCGPWFRHLHLSALVLHADIARRARFDPALRLAEDFDFLRQCADIAGGAVMSDRAGVTRGAGSNVWHGARTSDKRYSMEKMLTMKVLKRLRRSPRLDADDRRRLDVRILVARQHFFWAQHDRRRTEGGVDPGLWRQWIAADPSMTLFVIERLLKRGSDPGLASVPGDDL